MPQMSPMNWLFLSMFLLLVYYMFMLMLYFYYLAMLKKKKMFNLKNKFNIIW